MNQNLARSTSGYPHLTAYESPAVARVPVRVWLRAATVVASLLAPVLAPAALAVEPAEVVELKLGDKPVVLVDGVAGSHGHYFLIRSMAIVQPITVTMVSAPGSEVTLALVKDNWEKVERKASCRDGRPCELRFRTEGNFGLIVRADRGLVPFRLALSVSDAVVPPILTPMERGASSTLSIAYLGVASTGVLLLAVLVFLIWRRQK